MIRPLAIVTGASSGIGLELAQICAQEGYDLIVAADQAEIQDAAQRLRSHGGEVTAVNVDLATKDGVDTLWKAVGGRKVDASRGSCPALTPPSTTARRRSSIRFRLHCARN